MSIKEAYDSWSAQYDSNVNLTRDLEASALQKTVSPISFNTCLEIGCGTGKNTQWLMTKAKEIVAVDLSDAMLAKAKEKINDDKVNFIQADILQDWAFATKKYELVSFSLVLEHIQNLEDIFKKVSAIIAPGGYVYIGELHPFKQYTGSKARFTTGDTEQVVTCFNHNITDFTDAAKMHGFKFIDMQEFFDDDDRSAVPRILTLLFKYSL